MTELLKLLETGAGEGVAEVDTLVERTDFD